jgi:hypothetical protein
VERVAAGSAFRKSNRLRELFLFLCERTLGDPAAVIHEQEIGVEVFGRQPDYDTGQDALVRVQMCQLRKKLEQYFASEGRDEPVIIEIPKGGYTPVFRNRELESPPAGVTRLRRWFQGSRLLVLSFLGVGGVFLAAALLVWPGYLRGPARLGPDPGATVDRLWYQMFDNGRPTCVVLSDSNLGLFEDAIQRQLSLNEYRDKDFNRLGDELIKDPLERARWKQLVLQYSTHVSDARLAATFSALNAARHIPTEIVFAQDFAVAYLQSHNLILLGSRRTNPWLELFEDQLNFRSVFQETPALAYFRNRSPLPGESATYTVRWRKQGYCRVAFLPNPTRTRNVLVISGTEMASSEAGGQFISSERWIQALRSALGLGGKGRFPYFEILLKVDFVTWNTPKFDIVAHRIPRY